MGIAVFSGMLGVTFFGLIFTPLFYVLVRGIAARRAERGVLAPQDVQSLHNWPHIAASTEGSAHA
jgi:multidrug efflux pump